MNYNSDKNAVKMRDNTFHDEISASFQYVCNIIIGAHGWHITRRKKAIQSTQSVISHSISHDRLDIYRVIYSVYDEIWETTKCFSFSFYRYDMINFSEIVIRWERRSLSILNYI